MNESGFLVFATLIAFLWIDGRDCCNGEKPAPCMREAGIDYPGNNIRMDYFDNIENCEQACRGEKTCVGLTFSTSLHRCWLKRKLLNRRPHTRTRRTSSRCKSGTGGRNVISKKLMEPSSYTPDQDSKWLTPVYCPEGQFVKKMNVWQSDAAIDRKGLTNIELYCASTHDPLAEGIAWWIKSGLTKWRGDRLLRDNECPDSEWAAAARTAFQNRHTGAIRFYIGCRKPSDPFPTTFKIANNLFGYTGDNPVEWHTHTAIGISAELVSQFCDPGQAICGFRTNAETNHQLYDCSGINRVEIFCCPFP